MRAIKLTVRINGRVFNVSEIARSLNVDQSYLSRLLSGERTARRFYFTRLAEAMEMHPEVLSHGIQERKRLLNRRRQAELRRLRKWYDAHVGGGPAAV